MSTSQKRARCPSPEKATQIFISSSIEDRSSTFMAAFSPIVSTESLRALPEFANASHLMTAWRLRSKQRSLNSQPVFETGHDDDGEKYGGKTLENVLMIKEISGVLMVARWYGGVMLGPVRFEHIRNCAGNAIAQREQESERAAKRAKAEMTRMQLIEILSERDQSIAVLRGLLADKKQGAPSSQKNATASLSKAPDYASMKLAALGRLEQVRDKTIEWILARIEEAEKTRDECSAPQSLRNDDAGVKHKNSSAAAIEISGDMETVHEASAQSAGDASEIAIGPKESNYVSASTAVAGE